MQDMSNSPWCQWDLKSSGMLCNENCQLPTFRDMLSILVRRIKTAAKKNMWNFACAKHEAYGWGLVGVGSFTLRPLYPGGKITQFPFSSRWGMLQSRSKPFRGALKIMALLRIETNFLEWMGIRTETVYLTVAFGNVRNAHNGGKMYLVFIFRTTTEKYGFDTEHFRVLDSLTEQILVELVII